MNADQLKAWMTKVESRLDALEGKDPAAEEVAAKPNKPKTAANQFPKWVYRMVDGELQSALIEREEEMPEGAFESPEEAKAGASPAPAPEPTKRPEKGPEKTSEPEKQPENRETPIPDNWQDLNGNAQIALAKQLPGGEDVRTKDDAGVVIGLELERRGNAN